MTRVVISLAVAALALGGCASGGSTSVDSAATSVSQSPTDAVPTDTAPTDAVPNNGETSGGAPSPSAVSGLPDSCALLSDAEVTAINGLGGTATKDGSVKNETFALDACHYGQLNTGLVSVQVATPAEGFNPANANLSIAKSVVDLPSVPGGKGYDIGVMLGGGGVGYSVAASANGVQVVISYLGDKAITQGQKDAMAAALNSSLAKV